MFTKCLTNFIRTTRYSSLSSKTIKLIWKLQTSSWIGWLKRHFQACVTQHETSSNPLSTTFLSVPYKYSLNEFAFLPISYPYRPVAYWDGQTEGNKLANYLLNLPVHTVSYY